MTDARTLMRESMDAIDALNLIGPRWRGQIDADALERARALYGLALPVVVRAHPTLPDLALHAGAGSWDDWWGAHTNLAQLVADGVDMTERERALLDWYGPADTHLVDLPLWRGVRAINRVLAHELTHARQSERDPHGMVLAKNLTSYYNDPYEMEARRIETVLNDSLRIAR